MSNRIRRAVAVAAAVAGIVLSSALASHAAVTVNRRSAFGIGHNTHATQAFVSGNQPSIVLASTRVNQ